MKAWPRRLALLAAALAVLLALLGGILALGWISLDAQPLLRPVETALSRALGREVEIAGPARLTLSFRPALVVHDVRLGNPPGFAEPEFATFSELRLDTELLPLLRSRLIVRELRGRGVAVRLARGEDGRGNWVFEPAAPPPGEPPPRFRLDWKRLVAEQSVVEFVAAGAVRRVEMEKLVLVGLTTPPLRLDARGATDSGLAFRGKADSPGLPPPASPEPWPFTANLETPQSAASITGQRRSTDQGPVLRLHIDARTTDLDEIGALLGVALPVTGTAELAGELEFAPDRFLLRELKARLGGVDVSGELAVDTRGPRSHLGGRLAVPVVEVGSETSTGDAREASLAAAYAGLRNADLHLSRLSGFDADLELSIGHLAGSPGDVRDIDAMIRLDAGRLRAPFGATIGGAAFRGELSAEAGAAAPAFGLRLSTHEAPMGGLARLFFDLPHVLGTVQLFDAEFSASGRTPAELVSDLETRIRIEDARLSYGNYAGGRPIGLHLAAAELAQPRGGTIAASLRGSLREKPFEASAAADTVERLLRERQTPFRLDGASGGARLRLSGVLAEPATDRGPDIDFELSAPQARELAPWLGFSSQSTAAVGLGGRVRVQPDVVNLEAASLLFGRSSIEGELEWRRTAAKAQVKAVLAAGLLEPAELQGLRPPPPAGSSRTFVDIPVLPERLDFADLDLDLKVQHVQGLALDITDLAFTGQLKDGAIGPAPISLRLQGNALEGTLAFDTRGPAPTASLDLGADAFDAGAVLRRMRLAHDLDARLGKLRLQVAIEGARLGEALERSSFEAIFEQGDLSYNDAGTRSSLGLAVAGGDLHVESGGPVSGSLTGSAGGVPVRVGLEGGPLRALLAPEARWPFAITAELPEARWTLSGAATPGRQPATELSLSLGGRRLDDLDTLFATALPPWGPYELTGKLRLAPNVYRVEEARLAIGDSRLLGKASLDTGARPPRLEVELAAPEVQLDDFPLGEWSPLPASTGRMTASAARAALASGARSVRALLSRERLALGDAEVEIRVEQLLAGADELGRARFAAGVDGGVARLGPLEVEGRAGHANATLGYEPREQDAVFSARAKVDRFDYGMVAARFDPATEITGALSLDLAIDAVTPELPQLMNTASGHVDLAVWPVRLRWGGFDLWAANLLRSLLPFFSPTSSRLNCVIGQFDLDQGHLISQALLIDTTNTRTTGWAEAHFATERLRMRFVPGHKAPRLLSLAVPVEVRGTFSDYRIALRPTDALARVGHWFKSLAMVPLHWLGIGRVPEDGSDVCVAPSRQ